MENKKLELWRGFDTKDVAPTLAKTNFKQQRYKCDTFHIYTDKVHVWIIIII